ncbi:MAG TPA: hypothetical protein VJT49_34200 [Amycolatopsis sp.]|uniref:hypothetical protein n=1 Tax=Amycolatopsis sp. TaxID=37632 RepID=UPI002B495E0E|nr:hypothetical protein [Amycolatopsis sp.]HKS50075.1 hypothetical protein [Amycolatopsis sp.]
MDEPGEGAATIGYVGHDMDDAVGEVLGDGVDEIAGQVRLGAASLDRQRRQHRQRDRAGQERRPHHERGDDPVVTEAQLRFSRGRAVMKPARGVNFLAPAAEKGVTDRDRRARGQQPGHSGQRQINLPWIPACGGKKRRARA